MIINNYLNKFEFLTCKVKSVQIINHSIILVKTYCFIDTEFYQCYFNVNQIILSFSYFNTVFIYT